METAVKERPILFNGEMVRALLAGRKTQTRRIVKPQLRRYFPGQYRGTEWEWQHGETGYISHIRCPFGRVGDRLWVRETFHHWAIGGGAGVYWRADSNSGEGPWTPSIHMRREFSRIDLEVLILRADRLQEISHDDAVAEGVTEYLCDMEFDHKTLHKLPHLDAPLLDDAWRNATTIENFKRLWDSINAKRGYSWDANPYVWIVEFRRIK